VSLREALGSALEALRANPMRSALTMLGIIIGVASVILVQAIGAGAQRVVVEQIRSLGSNLLIIEADNSRGSATTPGSAPVVTEDDAQAIEREVMSVESAVPMVHGNVQLVRGDLNRSTVLYGSTAAYLTARDWSVVAGRNFTDEELSSGAKVALLGETPARGLFDDVDPIGMTVRIQRVPFTIIGRLAPKGQTTSGKDQDDVALVPLKTARVRVLGANPANPRAVETLMVKVREGANISDVQSDVRMLLRDRHHLQPRDDDDFWIKNLEEVLQIKEASARALALLVAAVASVSLLVGGIGIMNIMLVSVLERTREIGLRMAVGARRRDVLIQFLVESVMLSGIGGATGLLLGVVSAGTVAKFAGWPWIVRPSVVVVAVAFSVAVGIGFGLYPARRAAWLNPIEALRRE
jgi:ABC-type antimicrobial peptide transport system permease subunit